MKSYLYVSGSLPGYCLLNELYNHHTVFMSCKHSSLYKDALTLYIDFFFSVNHVMLRQTQCTTATSKSYKKKTSLVTWSILGSETYN